MYDFARLPKPLYTCVLFDSLHQSFEVLHSALVEGTRLGDAIGGDWVLRSSLNAMSERFWKKEMERHQQIQSYQQLCQDYQVCPSSHSLLVYFDFITTFNWKRCSLFCILGNYCCIVSCIVAIGP